MLCPQPLLMLTPTTRPESMSFSAALALATLALLLCAAVLLAHPAADYSLWYDEAWQVQAISSHDLNLIMETVRQDYAPPAYFLALSAWSSITGKAEPVLRYFSTLCALLTAAIVYRQTVDLYGARFGGTAAVVVLTTQPFFIRFANEARMYALLTACVAGSIWLFWRCRAQPGWAIYAGYVLVTAAALYTHYLGAFLIPLHLLYGGWQTFRRRAWHLMALPTIAGLCFLPWLTAFIAQLNDPRYQITHDHALPTDLGTITYVVQNYLFASQPVLYVLLLIPAIFTLGRIRLYRPGALGYLAIWGIGWPVLAWGSNLMVPQFQPRNVLPALPPLVILAGAGFARLPGWLNTALLAGVHRLTRWSTMVLGAPLPLMQRITQLGGRLVWLVRIITALLLALVVAGNLANFAPHHGHDPHYRDAVQELARGLQPGDIVFWQTNTYLHDIPIQHYLDRLLPPDTETIWLNPLDGAAVAAAVEDSARFWLLQTMPVDNRWIDNATPHVETTNVHVDAFQIARYERP